MWWPSTTQPLLKKSPHFGHFTRSIKICLALKKQTDTWFDQLESRYVGSNHFPVELPDLCLDFGSRIKFLFATQIAIVTTEF